MNFNLNISQEKQLTIKTFINTHITNEHDVMFAINELESKLGEYEREKDCVADVKIGGATDAEVALQRGAGEVGHGIHTGEYVEEESEGIAVSSGVNQKVFSVIKNTNTRCSVISETSSGSTKNTLSPQTHQHSHGRRPPMSSKFSDESQVLSSSDGTAPGSGWAGSLVPGMPEHAPLTDHSHTTSEKENPKIVLQPNALSPTKDIAPEFLDPMRFTEVEEKDLGSIKLNAEENQDIIITDELNEAVKQNNGYVIIPVVHTHQCAKCNKTFKTSNNLKKHEARHANDIILACRSCKKVFKKRLHLERHEKVHDSVKEKKYPCESCDKGFNRSDMLKRHIDVVHNIAKFMQCEFCARNFKHISGYTNHIQHCDKKNSEGNKTSKECMYVCEVCKKSFAKESYLKAHKLTHINLGDRASCKPYSCSKCGKKYAYINRQKVHELQCKIKSKSNYKKQHVNKEHLLIEQHDDGKELVDEQCEIVDAQRELVDAQLELVDTQCELVDEQRELVDEERVYEQSEQQHVIEHELVNHQELVNEHQIFYEHQRVIEHQPFDETVFAQLPINYEVIDQSGSGVQDFNYNIVSGQILNIGYYDEETGQCYKFAN